MPWSRLLRQSVPTGVLVAVLSALPAMATGTSGAWPDGKELAGRLIELARHERATLHEIGRSAGGQKLRLLEIAPAVPRRGGDPAVLLLANCEGELPLTSLAAVELAAAVLAGGTETPAAAVRWYVLPVASPDAHDRVFAVPRASGLGNAAPVDLDGDALEGEDPPDDLDQDGLITWMLVEDPAGTWALSDDGLPLAANPARGVPGRYRRESEGFDQDGDGRFNEDPSGGVDIARNFPHDFAAWTGRGGRWPADQPETRAILQFAFDHRDIALVIVLGEANNLYRLPVVNNRGDTAALVTVPWRLAGELGLEANAPYPLDLVLEAARRYGRRQNLTPARVRAMLSLEPMNRPPIEDLVWWQAMADECRNRLAAQGCDTSRLAPPLPGPGSPAAWAYFQYGTPAVALDLWSVPLPPPVAAADSTGSPVPAVADTSSPRPAPELAALKQRTEQIGLPGWRPWTEVTLPDGTRALVGGPEPGALRTPPVAEANVHVDALLPFVLELPGWLPRLTVSAPIISDRGSGVYEVVVHVGNEGRLPYPTTMGTINRRPPPVVVTLAGADALQENLRQVLPQLPAGGAVAVRWLVRTGRSERLSVTAEAPSLGTVTVTGGQR
ncbi:MAG: M14 family zinc carboxypeptidase [Candidatus Krumholzibacteria bacterium]|nr:M14 family zinc carboxypeptidase [Candidatus Krumholzibacteria bacterium]